MSNSIEFLQNMNRNSARTESAIIYVLNGQALGQSLYDLLQQLSKKLPDSEFRLQKLQQMNLFSLSNNSVFLVINTNQNEQQVQNSVYQLQSQQRKYVLYPRPISKGSGYLATNFNQLFRYLSQMLMQNIGSMSQISVNTINRTEKQNVSLHVIIAKSQDEQFRYCVKSLYKKYKSDPNVDFFESKTLQKVHTGLFPQILFIINQADVQTYRSGYDVFVSKKSQSGQITTAIYLKQAITPYGFIYDVAINSRQQLQNVLLNTLQKANLNKMTAKASLFRAKSFTQTVPIQPVHILSSILVLDSVDQKYRQFYSKIQPQYQRINHLNHPFTSKTILIVPSSARQFINQLTTNPNVKIVLISQQSVPSTNLKYDQGIQLITNNIQQLNSYLNKSYIKGKRVTDLPGLNHHKSSFKIGKEQKQNFLFSIPEQQHKKRLSTHETVNTAIIPQRVSNSNDFVSNNLSKVSDNNLQYTLSDNNQVTNKSLGSANSSSPRIGTTELILKQTKDYMKNMYDNYFEKQQQKPYLSGRTSNKKPSISINNIQYGNFEDQIVQQNKSSKSSIKVSSKKSSQNFNQEPELSVYSQIKPSIMKVSAQGNFVVKQTQSLITHSSHISGRGSMYKERSSKIGQRRSLMRNTPEQPHYTPSRMSYNQSSLNYNSPRLSSQRKPHQVSQMQCNQYYASGISSPRNLSSVNSPKKNSRPKSSKLAGKLSVIECIGTTKSKTISQMLQKQDRAMRQQSQIDQYQLDFGEQDSLQLIFKTSSPYIQHFSQYFEVYPCVIIRYSSINQLTDILPTLDRSILTVLVIDSQIVENVRMFKNFEQFNYIITCKQQNLSRLKHRYPNTVLMKQHSHTKSFKQLLSYVRYLKFKGHQQKISDKQLIPHISAIRTLRIYIPNQPQLQLFIQKQLMGYEIINYNTQQDLLQLLEGSLFSKTHVDNIIVLKNGQQKLIQYLLSSVFNVKKIFIYDGENDLEKLKGELLSMNS